MNDDEGAFDDLLGQDDMMVLKTGRDQIVRLPNGDTRVTWKTGKIVTICDYRLNAFGGVECVGTKTIVGGET
jgi:hypothetical protein